MEQAINNHKHVLNILRLVAFIIIQCMLLLLFYIEHENIIAHLTIFNCVWYSQCFTLFQTLWSGIIVWGKPNHDFVVI